MPGSGEGFLKEFLLAVFIAGVAVVAFVPAGYGTPEIAESEDRSCVVCHTALGRAGAERCRAVLRGASHFGRIPGRAASSLESRPESSRYFCRITSRFFLMNLVAPRAVGTRPAVGAGLFRASATMRESQCFLWKTLLKLSVVEVNLRAGHIICTI